jgi:hypothetical protein
MTSVLTIEGKEYVPATTAGQHFGYTKDYILLLIKQGHIDGQKIGNKWYVNIPSAEKHFRVARAKREVRKKQISLERKAELKAHTQVRKQVQKRTKRNTRPVLAFVEVLAVIVIAFSVGTAGYVGVQTQQANVTGDVSGFFGGIARSLYAFFNPSHTVTIDTITPSQVVSVPMEEMAVSAHVATTTYTSLVVAPDELFTATTVESIQDSFSDPVEVSIDPENPNTGIITPVFKESNGKAYRFLMVPVTEATTTQ